MQRSDTKSETKKDAATVEKKAEAPQPAAKTEVAKSAELSDTQTLSLITHPAAEPAAEPTVQLALLADPAVEPKRAANGE
jgi:hypothetical protein